MKIKTSELTGDALDWAVSKCEGRTIKHDPMPFSANCKTGGFWIWEESKTPNGGCCALIGRDFAPSAKWSDGGPLLDREDIAIGHGNSQESEERRFSASRIGLHPWVVMGTGPTKLIAAMRCYVASSLGDEVEVPNELCKT